MENLENLFILFPEEIIKSLQAMSKTSDVQLRKLHSEIIHNLSSSMEKIVNATTELAGDDYEDDFDEFDGFTGDFINELPAKPNAQGKGKKGKRDNEIPF